MDPLAPKYAHLSPFAYAANKPINNIDIDGAETPGETTTPTGNSLATEESSGQSNVPRIHGIHSYQVLRYLGLIPEAESRGDLSRNMEGYQMTPHYSNIDGKDQLLFYSAYNKASGEIDYIVGPGSFKRFVSDQGRYIIAASLMNNMSEGDLKRASGLELMQMGYTKEGWAMAWEGTVDVWKEALKSPEFYLSVINGLAVKNAYNKAAPTNNSATKGGSITLYRAVSKAELDDIAINGIRNSPGYETGKLFTTSAQDAANFGRLNFGLDKQPFTIIKTSIPNKYSPMLHRGEMDLMQGVSVPSNLFNQLSKPSIFNKTPLPNHPWIK